MRNLGLLPALSTLVAAALTFAAAGDALAADKFKVTSVDCEMFSLFRHTPVINYDIVDERAADYRATPDADYFRLPALRTADYCNRVSDKPQAPLAPPRKIRGVWFQSNDGRFKALFDLDHGGIDFSAGGTNRIAEQYAADQRAAAQQVAAARQHEAQLEEIRTREARAQESRAIQEKAQTAAAERQHEAQLEEIRTREARAREVKAAEDKAKQERVAAENAREGVFFARKDLQLSRLGTEVAPSNFALINDVRTNPFHFRKLGLAVVRSQFNRMISANVALFGNELAPILVHIEDVDRFTKSGETVMLALKVEERGNVERSYGSIPEIILSMLKAEPLFGEYVGAYSCPNDDCMHVFDAPPPS